MPARTLITALSLLAVTATASASPARFTARAHLRPAGCKTVVASGSVSITGCKATAKAVGTGARTMTIRYTARVDLSRGRGTQRGTVTLRGARAVDRLVLRFSGTVDVGTGGSSGRWRATLRRGVFARTAPRRGRYTSRTPDQGAHVTFDVRG